MARGRTRRPPIVRNLELYHEFICEHKTQAQIAAEFEISQPRAPAALYIQIDNPNSTVALIVVLRQNEI